MTFVLRIVAEFFGGSLRVPCQNGVGVGAFLAVFDRQNVKMWPVLVSFLITCLSISVAVLTIWQLFWQAFCVSSDCMLHVVLTGACMAIKGGPLLPI